MSDIEFADGFYAKEPHKNAPDFVKVRISIKREEFVKWLQDQSDEFINIDVLEAKSTGNWYGKVDRWNPDPSMQRSQPSGERQKSAREQMQEDGFDDDIPF